jgi:dolichol-phosphate hexosyltransferase
MQGLTLPSGPALPGPPGTPAPLDARTQAVVILPTLNEELGLQRTLSDLPFDRFRDPGYPIEAIIIDGGSTDRTLEVARTWKTTVLHQTTRGKGAAVLEAIHWVRQQGIPYVAVLDADATYPPEAILPALSLLREGTDLVIGVRRPVGGPPRNLRDLVHRIGNVALSYTASALSGRPILDICSGFWAVSTERFEGLEIGATRFAVEAELVLKALRADLKVAQIPIEYRERLGTAKIHATRDGGAILLSILEFSRGRRPLGVAPSVPGVPARQILSIGLIAESRTAVLEYPQNDVQFANRLGLMLQRGLPFARIRIRPSALTSGLPTSLDPACILVTLPAPGGVSGALPFSVLIRPREKELTIRVPPSSPGSMSTGTPPVARSRRARASFFRSRSRFLPGFGAVSTRVLFDPRRQQEAILLANGFESLEIGGRLAATFGGRP